MPKQAIRGQSSIMLVFQINHALRPAPVRARILFRRVINNATQAHFSDPKLSFMQGGCHYEKKKAKCSA